MSTDEIKYIDKDFEKAEAAYKRAVAKAREIAKRTGTPLVFYKDGKIVTEKVE